MGLMGALGLVPRFGTGDGESALGLVPLGLVPLGLVPRFSSLDQGLLSLRSEDFRTGLGDLWVALPEANIFAV